MLIAFIIFIAVSSLVCASVFFFCIMSTCRSIPENHIHAMKAAFIVQNVDNLFCIGIQQWNAT